MQFRYAIQVCNECIQYTYAITICNTDINKDMQRIWTTNHKIEAVRGSDATVCCWYAAGMLLVCDIYASGMAVPFYTRFTHASKRSFAVGALCWDHLCSYVFNWSIGLLSITGRLCRLCVMFKSFYVFY